MVIRHAVRAHHRRGTNVSNYMRGTGRPMPTTKHAPVQFKDNSIPSIKRRFIRETEADYQKQGYNKKISHAFAQLHWREIPEGQKHRAFDPTLDVKIPHAIIKFRMQERTAAIRAARQADPLVDI